MEARYAKHSPSKAAPYLPYLPYLLVVFTIAAAALFIWTWYEFFVLHALGG